MALEVGEQIATLHQLRDQAVEGPGKFAAKQFIAGNPGKGFVNPHNARFVSEKLAEVGFAMPCPGFAGYFKHTPGRQKFAATNVRGLVNSAEAADAKRMAHPVLPATNRTAHQQSKWQAQSSDPRGARITGGELVESVSVVLRLPLSPADFGAVREWGGVCCFRATKK